MIVDWDLVMCVIMDEALFTEHDYEDRAEVLGLPRELGGLGSHSAP